MILYRFGGALAHREHGQARSLNAAQKFIDDLDQNPVAGKINQTAVKSSSACAHALISAFSWASFIFCVDLSSSSSSLAESCRCRQFDRQCFQTGKNLVYFLDIGQRNRQHPHAVARHDLDQTVAPTRLVAPHGCPALTFNSSASSCSKALMPGTPYVIENPCSGSRDKRSQTRVLGLRERGLFVPDFITISFMKRTYNPIKPYVMCKNIFKNKEHIRITKRTQVNT